MDLKLTGKRAFVLGSSSGLGLASAKQLAEEGATVVISGRDVEKARRAAEIHNFHSYVTGDLTVKGSGREMVKQAAQKLGGLDIIIINTGGGTPGGIMDVSAEARDMAYNSMLNPALEAARAAAPFLQESENARMLFITARSIVEATPELALSSVFRSGVAAAARSLALELAPKVLVNVIIPGQFDTAAYGKFANWVATKEGVTPEQAIQSDEKNTPVGRLGRAEELADVVTFICSPRASFINGSVIRVDGGAVTGFH